MGQAVVFSFYLNSPLAVIKCPPPLGSEMIIAIGDSSARKKQLVSNGRISSSLNCIRKIGRVLSCSALQRVQDSRKQVYDLME
jgi:hypothetical protein